MPPATAVKAVSVSDDPQVYEDEHVHGVYDEIAPHFSSTRYKPWPIIAQFLDSIPAGWVGLDSGTGNGKYLPLPLERPGSVWTIGLDRSRSLLEIARTAGGSHREVAWGDVLGRPWRPGAFDYAISIATIHHLSTHARRKAAVQRLLECISPSHGRALIYVWAIEQDELSKRTIPCDSSEQAPASQEKNTPLAGQDVFVPWVLSPQNQPKAPSKRKHEFRNKGADGEEQQVSSTGATEPPSTKIFNRYYHMFAQGELPDLVCEAARDLGLAVGNPKEHVDAARGIEVVQDGWERSNYYIELRRWEYQ
ncbi:hypothetical protein WOLCODRAFT_161252 [Wolfiporia cocos MD-104 SS10]|uniref:Methyltransferase domain-containing protein n=1 Tax=Wolfiporia cocos (strain MD-104) TaxID=742152 RepID=A0A2H3J739_WOLCO|nr:hypothetical protein WOLCODRAFT_161252 [Wolfiporia cocos MD-104 SS10]